MAGAKGGIDYSKAWQKGHLYRIDDIKNGDQEAAIALKSYADQLNKNRQSIQWQRTVKWVENVFFTMGRQYIDNILLNRLAATTADLPDGESGTAYSLLQEAGRNIPKPTNDILGRYVETNISLLTENRPRPRVTPKSDAADDVTAAELSELTLEYLWESLNMAEKHREVARMLIHWIVTGKQ